MQTLHTTTFPLPLSSSNSIYSLSLLPKLSALSLTHPRPPPSTLIRMGGGPRTYPGGVSKWQWKRMQAKKAKQLLKARLARERQIYEMRKRAELKAAVSDLERPWEVVRDDSKSRATSCLFSVSADEQLKVLADRFQKPGGFDLWSESDGPQIFHTHESLPSARFFPKGVVHSLKPYGSIDEHSGSGLNGNGRGLRDGDEDSTRIDRKRGRRVNGGDGNVKVGLERGKKSVNGTSDKLKRNETKGRNLGRMKRNSDENDDDVYDLSLQGDGSYGFSDRKKG